MTEPFKFWAQKNWPADPTGYVFLARAFDRIGRRVHGSEWTGREGLALFVGDLGLNGLGPVALRDVSLISLALGRHVTDWTEARTELEAAAERGRDVWREVYRAGEAGQITAAQREKDGGMVPIEPHLWNGENHRARFSWCMMSRRDPFGPGIGGDGYGYIFLTADSLNQYAGGEAEQSAKFTASSEVNCERWLGPLLDASDPKTKSKPDFYGAAKEQFPGLSDRAWERAWGAATTSRPAWRASGRKRVGG